MTLTAILWITSHIAITDADVAKDHRSMAAVLIPRAKMNGPVR